MNLNAAHPLKPPTIDFCSFQTTVFFACHGWRAMPRSGQGLCRLLHQFRQGGERDTLRIAVAGGVQSSLASGARGNGSIPEASVSNTTRATAAGRLRSLGLGLILDVDCAAFRRGQIGRGQKAMSRSCSIVLRIGFKAHHAGLLNDRPQAPLERDSGPGRGRMR